MGDTRSVGLPWTGDQPVAEAATCTVHNKSKGRTFIPPAGFILHSLLLCLYFIHSCWFLLIVLHLAPCPYCTTQTSMPPAGFELAIPASQRSAPAVDCISFILFPTRPHSVAATFLASFFKSKPFAVRPGIESW